MIVPVGKTKRTCKRAKTHLQALREKKLQTGCISVLNHGVAGGSRLP